MDKISEILESRKKPDIAPVEENKFFSIPAVGSTQENFLELRFKNGLRTCFDFAKLEWFNHDPDTGYMDMDFNGFLVSVKGRGLDKLFVGIKNKQCAWIKEHDSEFQDNDKNESFVESITVKPPEGFGGENTQEEEAEPA